MKIVKIKFSNSFNFVALFNQIKTLKELLIIVCESIIHRKSFKKKKPTIFYTFQCNYFASWIHDGAVCWNWSSNWITWVIHVNDYHLSLLSYFLSNADEFVWLHSQGTKANVCWVYTQVLELEEKQTNINKPWHKVN